MVIECNYESIAHGVSDILITILSLLSTNIEIPHVSFVGTGTRQCGERGDGTHEDAWDSDPETSTRVQI